MLAARDETAQTKLTRGDDQRAFRLFDPQATAVHRPLDHRLDLAGIDICALLGRTHHALENLLIEARNLQPFDADRPSAAERRGQSGG